MAPFKFLANTVSDLPDAGLADRTAPAVGPGGGVGVRPRRAGALAFGYFVRRPLLVATPFWSTRRHSVWLIAVCGESPAGAAAVITAIGAALARFLWTREAYHPGWGGRLNATEWCAHAFTGSVERDSLRIAAPLPLAQKRFRLIGLWGLTFIAIVVYFSPATLADDRAENPGRGCALVLGHCRDR